jgi:RTX calcium-binding nonapeptide repeat (4 copies)
MLSKQSIKWISIGLAAAMAILAVVAVTSSVSAARRPPPATLVHNGETLQKGKLGTYCWTFPGGGGCADTFGYQFPRGVWVPAGATVAIRLDKDEKPNNFDVTAWRKVDNDGQPIGDGRGLRNRLSPIKENGDVVAWKATFELRRGGRHYYLSTFVKWADKGDASYDFHAKTRGELTCGGRVATLVGGPGADDLVGTKGNDVIVARGGDDDIVASDGDDRICGGSGGDYVHGGRGRDGLLLKGGHDQGIGGRGKDRLKGGLGRDDLRGGPGRDHCSAGESYRGCELRSIRID